MESTRTWLIARDDTLLGVCHGLGEDLGLHPNWLRLALAVATMWNPVVAVGAYFAAGALVAATRLAFPDPAPAPAPSETAPETAEETEKLPLAA